MNLVTAPYLIQLARWPRTGQHILAQYNDSSVVVYQAYRPSIGHFAAQHGYFGGEFSFSRMSWVKPGFLWMMYRSGWAGKSEQEVALAVRITRAGFDELLREAVHSTYREDVYGDQGRWKAAVERSEVRVQWDPDHDPAGAKMERRALQLGLRGSALTRYGREWIVEIEDITDFVHEHYEHVRTQNYGRLITPRETVYPGTTHSG